MEKLTKHDIDGFDKKIKKREQNILCKKNNDENTQITEYCKIQSSKTVVERNHGTKYINSRRQNLHS